MFSAEFRAKVAAEFQDAELGDARRPRRLLKIVERVSLDPSASFPAAMGTPKRLEAFYRFMSNPGFDAAEMLTPHNEGTIDRAKAVGEIVCIHDSTVVEYSGESREMLGATNTKNHQGYVAHVSLAVRADSSRMPLGVLGVETYTRTGTKTKGKKRGAKKKTKNAPLDPERESRRWWRAVEHVEDVAENAFAVIHVADAEADFFELLARMSERGCRYVIRAGQLDRRVANGTQTHPLREMLDALQPQTWRTIDLSKRADKGHDQPDKQRKRHPPRAGRQAEVAIAATTVMLPRTRYCDAELTHVPVNVVRVWEPAPPNGEPAIEWVLFTSEPIAELGQLERVVDLYRLRWIIEEFFKALKTGCALEKRQLGSYDALCKGLALFIPIAYQMLSLRSLEATNPDAPASDVCTAIELHVLTMVAEAHAAPPVTVRDVLALLARLGGHIKHNGRPGWQVLGRGYEKLLAYCAGYELARAEPTLTKRKKYDQ